MKKLIAILCFILLCPAICFPATFGYVFSGSETDTLGGDTNRVLACKFTMPEDGDVTSLTILLSGDATDDRVKGLIYQDDGTSTLPGTLLGATGASDLIGTKGSYTVTFSPAISLTASDVVYLSIVCYSAPTLYYTSGSNAHVTATGNYSTPAKDPTYVTDYTLKDCIYATYTATATGAQVIMVTE